MNKQSIDPAASFDIDRVVKLLRKSRSVLFITGAGISASSGVPTYRGVAGLYNADTTEDGYPIEEILTAEMLHARPELTWKYLAQIAHAVAGAKHNRAHEIIAQLEPHFERFWVLTQNVDDFHLQAGSKHVLEIHGNMRHLYCEKCGHEMTVADLSRVALPPECPVCHAMMRPRVVLFGEMLPTDVLSRLKDELQQGFDLTITIGTSSVFQYIMAPIYLARQQGQPTVEINPGRSEVSDMVTIRLPLDAVTAMGAIWSRWKQAKA